MLVGTGRQRMVTLLLRHRCCGGAASQRTLSIAPMF